MINKTTDRHQDKIAFASKKEAENAALVAKHTYGSPAKRTLRPYLCNDCTAWHLSSEYSEDDNE